MITPVLHYQFCEVFKNRKIVFNQNVSSKFYCNSTNDCREGKEIIQIAVTDYNFSNVPCTFFSISPNCYNLKQVG